MSQLTLYLPESLASAVQHRAKREKLSVSAYVTAILQREVAPTTWSDEFIATAGSGMLEVPEDLPPDDMDF